MQRFITRTLFAVLTVLVAVWSLAGVSHACCDNDSQTAPQPTPCHSAQPEPADDVPVLAPCCSVSPAVLPASTLNATDKTTQHLSAALPAPSTLAQPLIAFNNNPANTRVYQQRYQPSHRYRYLRLARLLN